MITKTMIVSLFALSLLALTGIGYATFTSTIYVNGTATAGTLNIAFAASPYLATGTTSPVGAGTCSFSGTGSSTTLTVTNMAPGDTCTATITVANTGSLPTASETTSITAGSYLCSGVLYPNCFIVYDNLGLNSFTGATGSGGPVASGGNFAYNVEVAYVSASTSQGLTGTFTIAVTGSVGS
jgi:hypothetical protein